MSLLTPLYVLGLLAVSLPVVFHLIRRAPRGNYAFSSLMFLSPSPPRLTRRSRLDHVLLLILRGLVIGLLTFAFARPFLRQSVPPGAIDAERQRMAIVVDTSASMRRGDLWQQAVEVVDEVMAEGRPHDEVALFACDDTLRTLASFEEMADLTPAQRRSLAQRRLASVSPTWGGTQLGRGLLDAVEIVSSVAEPKGEEASPAQQIVLVTDLQQGSRLDALALYEWPSDLPIDLRTLTTRETTNAGIQLLGDGTSASTLESPNEYRVSVYNDKQSATDQFQLVWLDEENQPLGQAIDVYVPAGESRVLRVPAPVGVSQPSTVRLRLTGDVCDFDNTLYLAATPQVERTAAYLGADRADEPAGLRYYLERAVADAAGATISLRAAPLEGSLKLAPPAETPLVVVAAAPTAEQTNELQEYVEAGGNVLWVLTGDHVGEADALATLMGIAPFTVEAATVDGYTMWGQIAFDHPLFATMAGPQFNDFTQIRFWDYRRLTSPEIAEGTDVEVVARFEKGDPAVIVRKIGEGQVVLFTSSWQPSDSQLARSWKFVLLLTAMLESRRARLWDRAFFVVNEPVPLRKDEQTETELTIVKPDGARVLIDRQSQRFDDTDQPGVYVLQTTEGGERFAVNVDPAESRTSPLAVQTLEQMGARLVQSAPSEEDDEERRQLADVQLESRQKIWQWLIAAAFCVAISETWLAGRITKRVAASE